MSFQYVSLVMPYYDNGGMLERHLQEWQTYIGAVRMRLRIVIVDDGSPTKPAADIIRRSRVRGLDIQVYRVVPDIPWNQDGARNLGMRACNTPFALMTDMDHVLNARDAEKMVRFVDGGLERGRYYMPRQFVVSGDEIPRHPNTFLFNVTDFWAMGGYDEDFAGAYGSDGNFRKCARAWLAEIPTSAFGLTVWRKEDCADANTTRYGRKDSEFHSHKHPRLVAKMKLPPYRAERPIRFEWIREI